MQKKHFSRKSGVTNAKSNNIRGTTLKQLELQIQGSLPGIMKKAVQQVESLLNFEHEAVDSIEMNFEEIINRSVNAALVKGDYEETNIKTQEIPLEYLYRKEYLKTELKNKDSIFSVDLSDILVHGRIHNALLRSREQVMLEAEKYTDSVSWDYI